MAKELMTREITVNGKDYFVTDWTTTKTYQNMFVLGKLFAPISSLMSEMALGGEKMQEVLPSVILYICTELEGNGFEKTFKLLTSDVTGEGGVGNLEMDDLDPDEVVLILTKMLELRYASFFANLKKSMAPMIQEVLKLSNLNQHLNQKPAPKKTAKK